MELIPEIRFDRFPWDGRNKCRLTPGNSQQAFANVRTRGDEFAKSRSTQTSTNPWKVLGTTVAASAANVPININTATDAEILRIPGMGPRMLHDFKEYRPYASIAQFRREIGKCVDKAEVARLEQYILIK
ncbi:MAG: helix-hairpin-helix domain-containing protein [Armatimonadetes bacterium]|nr:helix-hairpin-helix domain-containing protein [Armatimonadota bacterium]